MDRDELAAKVDRLMATQEALTVRLREIEASTAAPEPLTEPTAGGDPSTEPASSDGAQDDRSSLPEVLEALAYDAADLLQPRSVREDLDAQSNDVTGAAGTSGEAVTALLNGGQAGRMITFDDARYTAADGVEAYRAGDYDLAGRIWRSLAMSGDMRAQFYLGSLLFEGRLGHPDRVMAYGWLKLSVDSGYLPAIEMRRRIRSSMSEAE